MHKLAPITCCAACPFHNEFNTGDIDSRSVDHFCRAFKRSAWKATDMLLISPTVNVFQGFPVWCPLETVKEER